MGKKTSATTKPATAAAVNDIDDIFSGKSTAQPAPASSSRMTTEAGTSTDKTKKKKKQKADSSDPKTNANAPVDSVAEQSTGVGKKRKGESPAVDTHSNESTNKKKKSKARVEQDAIETPHEPAAVVVADPSAASRAKVKQAFKPQNRTLDEDDQMFMDSRGDGPRK